MKTEKIKCSIRRYPLEAVLHACYVLTSYAQIILDIDASGKYYILSIESRGAAKTLKIDDFKRHFTRELNDYALRYSILKNNKRTREYIIGRAIFSISPLLEPWDDLDYRKDPLGITKTD